MRLRRGTTLVEILIATLIMGTILGGLIKALNSVKKVHRKSEEMAFVAEIFSEAGEVIFTYDNWESVKTVGAVTAGLNSTVTSLALLEGATLTATAVTELDTSVTVVDDKTFSHLTRIDVALSWPSIDGNTVDTQQEVAEFTKNTMQYQASFQLLSGRFKSLNNAIRGE